MSMERVSPDNFRHMMRFVDPAAGGAVYALSVCEMSQHGEIFTDHDTVLFWHDCGFSLLYGAYDEQVLEQVYQQFLLAQNAGRRFVLFAFRPETEQFFREKEHLAFGKREFFAYPPEQPFTPEPVPQGYHLCGLDGDLPEILPGRITPRFSWRKTSEFLHHGKGFCLMQDSSPAAWAFSAAVSAHEIDIGVETAPEHRHCGLGIVAAGQMVRYCLGQHKRPVWACDAQNAGSRRIAEKLGFVKESECVTVRRSDI